MHVMLLISTLEGKLHVYPTDLGAPISHLAMHDNLTCQDKSDKEKSTDKTEGGGKSKKSKGKHADDDGQEDAAPSKRRRRDASKGQ